MQSVRLADAQSRLPALIDAVIRGEEIVIIRDDVPVARLSSTGATPANRPSLRDHKPLSVGGMVARPASDDDLLAEMLDDRS